MISSVEEKQKLPTSGLVTVIYNLAVLIHVPCSLSSAIKYQQYIHDRPWLWKLLDSLHNILVINFQRHINFYVRRPFKSIPYHSIWQLSIYCLNYNLVKHVTFLDNLSQNVKNFNSFCYWNLFYSRYMELNLILGANELWKLNWTESVEYFNLCQGVLRSMKLFWVPLVCFKWAYRESTMGEVWLFQCANCSSPVCSEFAWG